MPIPVTCPSCRETLAAPEGMAGKRVVCPHCQGAIDIPAAPQATMPPRLDEPPDEPVEVGTLNIAKTAENDAQTADEKAALRVLRIVYVMMRDDWRRLFTCPLLWPGLLLFFLPWVDLSCAPRTIATQTGLQTTYGAYTIDAKFDKALRGNRIGVIDAGLRPKADDRAPWSFLTIFYIVLVLLGAFFGFVCIFFVLFRVRIVAAATHLFSLGMGSAAFAALGLQMAIGFPIEQHAKDHMQKVQDQRNRQIFGMRPIVQPEMEGVDFETQYSLWLWASATLAFLAAPTFLLEFGVLLVQIIRHFRRPHLETG